VVRGLSNFGPLNIVHFDAHLDYTHDVQGVLYTHGSPIRRCHELPFVNHITSIGIRAARRKPYEEAINDGSLIISSNRFRELGPQGVADLIPPAENLYITFDIDVMDPSLAPGTGTPETGGLFYQEVRDCVNALLSKPGASNGGGAARNPLVAFDMVEVAPPYDSSELTVQVAARLILDMLIARFPSK
jgi:agmatinase